MSLNLCGVKSDCKRKCVRNLCVEHGITVFGIQETKMIRVDLFCVKAMWGNYQFDIVDTNAQGVPQGRSGGIPTISDLTLFLKLKFWSNENVLIVERE